MTQYDLVVIGSGPAGQRAAVQASKAGKTVCLIEKREAIGGACVNTGTIPSKTMREAVVHLSGYNYQNVYGINYRVKERITMADLVYRVHHTVRTELEVMQNQLNRNGIDVMFGAASFVDCNTLRVEGYRGSNTISGRNFLIAVGTRPAESDRVPINGINIVNSDQILTMPEIPKTLIVVGGGVIGVEYACMFAVLGVRVILVEKRPRLLEFADGEMVEALSYQLRDRRVTLRMNEEVRSVDSVPGKGVVAYLESNKSITGDALLYAIGRQGNVDDLNLAAAGLEADNRGRIKVNENYETAVPHIYAAGDVIGFPSLASTSMEQGRIAAANALGIKVRTTPNAYPYGIYTIPEISFIGKTEEQLTEEDVPYETGVAFYRETARGNMKGETDGRLKIIFHRETRKLLGVHIIGEGAAELLHIGQAVLSLNGTMDYFVDTVFNYPTLAECYKAAAFNGLNKVDKLDRMEAAV
jgi:NAD(P) transhydrogenase